MNAEPVGIGLVGAGAFGRFCLDAFSVMPEVRIAAIADVDAGRAQASAATYHAQAYTELDALLANPDVEIVALNTPPYLHMQQGLSILRAGKHLFCEKPLALTVEDGEELIRAARENNVRLTVDYVMRYNPFWSAAASLARSGVLGRLRHMDLANHAAGLDLPANHWFWDRSKSGGIWVEHGVHFFDAFAWVAAQPGQVVASHAFQRSDGVVDRVEALARFGDAAAHFYHAFDQSGRSEQTTVKLAFEQGYVTLFEWAPTSIHILTTVALDELKPFLSGAIETERLPDQRLNVRVYAPEGKSTVYRACIQAGMRDLVAATRNPAHSPEITGENALTSLSMALAADCT